MLKFERPNLVRSFLIIALISFASCKGTGLGTDLTADSEVEYNIFWDQHDHLKELTAAGKYSEAEKVFEKHEAFFTKDLQKYRPDLTTLAGNLNSEKAKPLLRRVISGSRESPGTPRLFAKAHFNSVL